jgi:hypothetical protein
MKTTIILLFTMNILDVISTYFGVESGRGYEVNYKETFLGASFENTYIIDTKLRFSNSEWQKAKPIINNN